MRQTSQSLLLSGLPSIASLRSSHGSARSTYDRREMIFSAAFWALQSQSELHTDVNQDSRKPCLFWAHAGTHQLLRLAPGQWPHDAQHPKASPRGPWPCPRAERLWLRLRLRLWCWGRRGRRRGHSRGFASSRLKQASGSMRLGLAPVGSGLAGSFSEAPLGQIKAGSTVRIPILCKLTCDQDTKIRRRCNCLFLCATSHKSR